ncbi:lysylphosphatidylglycerol synthase domain-containing protein [Microbacterium chocolatum]|uniref:lysylphosphatidylglycerol synthase domain-containing protein n=1 Tax=Microbacterium aurantiacum TaxID=162393 RepID=UPI00338F0069
MSLKSALRFTFLGVAVALIAWAIYASWDQFLAAIESMTWPSVVTAFLTCLLALGVNALSWRAVMRSVGFGATITESLRVFLLSQVGKYIPGSVWPVLAQAEFARDHGVNRSSAMTGSIVAMVVGVVTSGVVGCVGLVAAAPATLSTYWWVLLVTLGLAACLAPPILHRIAGLALRVAKRDQQPARIRGGALLESILWSLLMWLLLGFQAWMLLRDLAPAASFAIAAGAFAFAWLVGFLVVVAPAGIGAREAALVLALANVVEPAQALSLAVISRVLMTAADAAGLAIGLTLGGRPRSSPRAPASGAGQH